ncbi:hypothetical protein LR48_Vigan11g164600 [Vigna angularis]|uniref:Uncharacterized protein n=1 Tax=Phaseolus angularis TaxID=3914 RepID=A0A0L9VUU6_PHAAN|nr:hypothetical protein LR48_Vigan11g164600 [Vigna angularis]
MLEEWQGDRNIIWQDILMTFDIPNVTTLRNKCLSTVAENFRNFKSKLTSRYIFGHLKHKSPCSSYKSIDEETWRLFKESRMSEEWQKQSTRNKCSQQKPPPIPLSEDDPLSSLHVLVDILDDKPLEVEYDANVFGTGSEVPIYLNSQDVRELASGTQELNISIIQLWTMYMSGVSNKLGRSDDYGFIDPQSIHESNDFEHINMNLIRRFGRGKKIYFLPYISGSIPASMMMGGRSIVNSRKIARISLKRFKTTTPVPEKSQLFIRNAAAKYIIRLYSSS